MYVIAFHYGFVSGNDFILCMCVCVHFCPFLADHTYMIAFNYGFVSGNVFILCVYISVLSCVSYLHVSDM